MRISNKHCEYFKKKGEIKLKSLLTSKEVLNIKKAVKEFIKKKKGNLSLGKNYNFVNNSNQISSLHRLEKYKKELFYKISSKKKFINIADKLLGSKSKMLSVQFFFKNKKENKPTPLHQDNAYWCYKNGQGLSFWMALNDTNKKNGCLYYHQGSHDSELKHYPSSNTPGSSQIIKNLNLKFKKKSYKLKSGDGVIHNSRTIHGSYKNISNKDRSAFIICFLTKNSKKDFKKEKSYEKNLIQASKKKTKLH